MIPILRCDALHEAQIFARKGDEVSRQVEEQVRDILAQVRAEGDLAVRAFTRRFDGADLSDFRVSPAECAEALARTDPNFLETLRMAAANIRAFHRRQLRQDFVVTDQPGVVLGQKITPLARVGLYIPGGTASYPSTVLMSAIPAKLAGVEELIMVTPPAPDGTVPDAILAAAHVAGVTAIYKMGGAQAVAALAYGTESVPQVDKIVGPGNLYVATAKRQVFGLVDIDMIAGPSEILVIADQGANPVHLAADLLSQAEHDPMASAVLVCLSEEMAQQVADQLEIQLALLPRHEIARTSLTQNGKLLVAGSLEEAVAVSNRLAPEHLELSVADPFALLGLVRNAGSIFLGYHTPEALGDYWAGPNHTLPTAGTARFSSPLSAEDFQKKSSFLCYTREALAAVSGRVADFARSEGLEAHARSALSRQEG